MDPYLEKYLKYKAKYLKLKAGMFPTPKMSSSAAPFVPKTPPPVAISSSAAPFIPKTLSYTTPVPILSSSATPFVPAPAIIPMRTPRTVVTTPAGHEEKKKAEQEKKKTEQEKARKAREPNYRYLCDNIDIDELSGESIDKYNRYIEFVNKKQKEFMETSRIYNVDNKTKEMTERYMDFDKILYKYIKYIAFGEDKNDASKLLPLNILSMVNILNFIEIIHPDILVEILKNKNIIFIDGENLNGIDSLMTGYYIPTRYGNLYANLLTPSGEKSTRPKFKTNKQSIFENIIINTLQPNTIYGPTTYVITLKTEGTRFFEKITNINGATIYFFNISCFSDPEKETKKECDDVLLTFLYFCHSNIEGNISKIFSDDNYNWYRGIKNKCTLMPYITLNNTMDTIIESFKDRSIILQPVSTEICYDIIDGYSGTFRTYNFALKTLDNKKITTMMLFGNMNFPLVLEDGIDKNELSKFIVSLYDIDTVEYESLRRIFIK